MTDEEGALLKEFERFLDSVGANTNCPVCGHDTWNAALPAPPGAVMAALSRRATLSCAKCGAIRDHDWDVFLAWRRSSGAVQPQAR